MTLENTFRLSVPVKLIRVPCIIRQTLKNSITKKEVGTISCCYIRQSDSTTSRAQGMNMVHTGYLPSLKFKVPKILRTVTRATVVTIKPNISALKANSILTRMRTFITVATT